jgi:transcriptional regulator with XRE-family HTH domain
LAVKIGVTPATLYRWLNAQFDPSLPKLDQLAEAMNVSLAWLVTGNGPADRRQAIRHALLEAYATTEFEPAGGVSEKPPVAFYEPWLLELLYGPLNEPALIGAADLKVPLLMEVREDSMEPTIGKGDLLLVDRSFGMRRVALERSRSGQSPYDGIYAFRSRSLGQGGESPTGLLIVRRVQYRLDGTMAVRCDNPNYPEEVYPLKAPNRPVPLGRVVWRGTRI